MTKNTVDRRVRVLRSTEARLRRLGKRRNGRETRKVYREAADLLHVLIAQASHVSA